MQIQHKHHTPKVAISPSVPQSRHGCCATTASLAPPKPTVADGLLTLMKVLSTTLATEKFRKHAQMLVDVGLAPAELVVRVGVEGGKWG